MFKAEIISDTNLVKGKDLVDYKKCFRVFLKDIGHFKSLLENLNIK